MVQMNNIYVHVVDFKTTKIKEAVTCNEDGSYSIFLNAKLTHEQQSDAYIHALGHIMRLDFENTSCVDLLEAYAHKKNAI